MIVAHGRAQRFGDADHHEQVAVRQPREARIERAEDVGVFHYRRTQRRPRQVNIARAENDAIGSHARYLERWPVTSTLESAGGEDENPIQFPYSRHLQLAAVKPARFRNINSAPSTNPCAPRRTTAASFCSLSKEGPSAADWRAWSLSSRSVKEVRDGELQFQRC